MNSQTPVKDPGDRIIPSNERFRINGKFSTGLLAIGILLITGIAAKPLERQLQAVTSETRPRLQLEDLEQGAGQGLIFAVLGGVRTLVADILWLKTMIVWESENLEKTHSLIQFTTTVDPRPKFFWINGARIIANDMPHWEAAQGNTPEQTKRNTVALAHSAIALLEKAKPHHDDKPDILLEIGNIHLTRLRDARSAAEMYRKAYIEHESTPYYVARLYGQLLRRMGRNEEAYKFLTELHSTLPDGIVYAQKNTVLRRIRQLEKTLEITPGKSFRPVARQAD